MLTKNECLCGWFYCKVWFSPPLSSETPAFFRRAPRQMPQKSLWKGLWNQLEHRHGLSVNGFCGVHLDGNGFWRLSIRNEPNLTPNCLQTNAKMIQFKSLQASPDTIEWPSTAEIKGPAVRCRRHSDNFNVFRVVVPFARPTMDSFFFSAREQHWRGNAAPACEHATPL